MHGFVGCGISYRPELAEGLLAESHRVGVIEILTDHYMEMPPIRETEAKALASVFPTVIHGVDLSLGSDQPLDRAYLQRMQKVAEWVKPSLVSDHLCFTRIADVNIGQLTPLPYTKEMARIVAQNVMEAQTYFDIPFMIENISYYFDVPPKILKESQFITEIVEKSSCLILLDLTNTYNNYVNNGQDAYQFLDEIPLEAVGQIHLAGSREGKGLLLDTHSDPVPEAVFEMLDYAAPRLTRLKAVILERDQDFPPFSEIAADLEKAERILRHRGAISGPRAMRFSTI